MIWLLAKEAVLTQESLSKRGHQLVARCFLCGEQTETINHFFCIASGQNNYGGWSSWNIDKSSRKSGQ
uniref:Putative ovule protein n=1 Tax=Solanum chacoense TaxID=4108 RepID=A0A0V0GSU3_SOLCH